MANVVNMPLVKLRHTMLVILLFSIRPILPPGPVSQLSRRAGNCSRQAWLPKTNSLCNKSSNPPPPVNNLPTFHKVNQSILMDLRSTSNPSMAKPRLTLSPISLDKWEWARNNCHFTPPISSLRLLNLATSNDHHLKFVFLPILAYRLHLLQMPIPVISDLLLMRYQRHHHCWENPNFLWLWLSLPIDR